MLWWNRLLFFKRKVYNTLNRIQIADTILPKAFKVGEKMEQKRAAELLNENLKKIFAFSISRLYNKNDAEDLTNEIVLNVMESVHRLQNDDAFYGFM